MTTHEVARLLEFHGRMLADAARVDAFRRALAAVIEPGAVVVDVGAGTGLLSVLACRAGARRVYAIEQGPIFGFAREIIRASGFGDRIVLVRGLSTEISLPEPADVLVTETIGVAGFDEGILGSVLDARRRLLRPYAPPAAVLPRRIRLWAVPVTAPALHEQFVGRWREGLAGIDASPLRAWAAEHLHIVAANPATFAAPPVEIVDVDLAMAQQVPVAGQGTFTVAGQALVHGFVLWFDAELAEGIGICNAPAGIRSGPAGSSWRQAFVAVLEPIAVGTGACLHLRLETDGDIWRWSGGLGAGGAGFDHSTDFGAPIDRLALEIRADDHRPQRSVRLEAAAAVLGRVDGQATVSELDAAARKAASRSFATEGASCRFVDDLLALVQDP